MNGAEWPGRNGPGTSGGGAAAGWNDPGGAGGGRPGGGGPGGGRTGGWTGPDRKDTGWLDPEADRLVRPYTVSNGRTAPSLALDMLTMVRATGSTGRLDLTPEHAMVLALSRAPVTVSEIGARLRLPVAVAKILLADLIDQGAVSARPPVPAAELVDPEILQRVLDGLRKRLVK